MQNAYATNHRSFYVQDMFSTIIKQLVDGIISGASQPENQSRVKENILDPLMKYLFWKMGPIIMGMYLLLLIILVMVIMIMYRLNTS